MLLGEEDFVLFFTFASYGSSVFDMLELIALIILLCSLAGIGIMIFQKIPLFLELQKPQPVHFNWKELFSKIRTSRPLEGIPTEIILQKILSKIRILTLKTDNKTSNWLQRLRKRSQEKKSDENDKYWDEIKKPTKE